MAIINLIPQLWIRKYNGFAVKLDLRQTGITKNLGIFVQKFFL